MTSRRRNGTDLLGVRLPLPLLYFLSGIPALIYQTVWQRLLVLHSGVGTVSIAMIVSVYMLGLGIGSLLGASVSRRVSQARSLQLFAAAELTVGLCGLLSPWALYEFTYLQYGALYTSYGTAFLLHTAVLIVPTTLMGMTLPLMTRALVCDAQAAAGAVSNLYGLNTLGAALGALIAPWFIMPLAGVTGAVYAGAGINFFVAVFGIWTHGDGATGRPPEQRVSADYREPILPVAASFRVWAALYFLSGLTAIGLEIVWFRILDIAVKSTSYTFGTVLGTFLLCMAAGSLWGTRRAARIQNPLGAFLAVQCLILLVSGFIVVLLGHLPADLAGYRWFFDYWNSDSPLLPSLESLQPTLNLYFLFPLALMGIPTALMGFSFCLLQKGVQNDPASSGYRTGMLQAANIAGCTLGSLLTGTWLLGAVGSMTTLRVLLISSVIFAVLGIVLIRRRILFQSLLGLTILVLLLIPGNDDFWRRLHGQGLDSGAMVSEDVTGVGMLSADPNGQNWVMWAGGKSQSLLPYGGFHTKLGVMPVTLHPMPLSVAIIGLGSGDTAWGASCRTESQRIRVFEICTPEIELLNRESTKAKWPQVEQLLNDPRVSIDGVDARFSFSTEDATYDVIEADAIRPNGAFAGYLYSIEFFRLCGKRLNPGGFMCSWAPTPLVRATFRGAFPHVLELDNGLMLIGSNEPIQWSADEWIARIQTTSSFLPETVRGDCISSVAGATIARPSQPDDFTNTDLFPYDEFN